MSKSCSGSSSAFGVFFNLHADSLEPSPHADVIRTMIILCADQFIVLIFHCGPFILFSYLVL